jgi:hypothetical protein
MAPPAPVQRFVHPSTPPCAEIPGETHLTVDAFLRRSAPLIPKRTYKRRRRRIVDIGSSDPPSRTFERLDPDPHLQPLASSAEDPDDLPSAKRVRCGRAPPNMSVARRLLEAAATSGVDLPTSGPCAPPNGRGPLTFQNLGNRPASLSGPRKGTIERRAAPASGWHSAARLNGAKTATAPKRRGAESGCAELVFVPLDEHEAAWRARGCSVL